VNLFNAQGDHIGAIECHAHQVVSNAKHVYVAEDSAVQIYSTGGELLQSFEFDVPLSMCVDDDDRLAVYDWGQRSLTIVGERVIPMTQTMVDMCYYRGGILFVNSGGVHHLPLPEGEVQTLSREPSWACAHSYYATQAGVKNVEDAEQLIPVRARRLVYFDATLYLSTTKQMYTYTSDHTLRRLNFPSL
jgi:hypothetical protein